MLDSRKRKTPTFTVDTLTDLQAQFPDDKLFFITGTDARGSDPPWIPPGQRAPGRAVSLVEVPAMAISSTDCRERVARDQPVWYLAPDGSFNT